MHFNFFCILVGIGSYIKNEKYGLTLLRLKMHSSNKKIKTFTTISKINLLKCCNKRCISFENSFWNVNNQKKYFSFAIYYLLYRSRYRTSLASFNWWMSQKQYVLVVNWKKITPCGEGLFLPQKGWMKICFFFTKILIEKINRPHCSFKNNFHAKFAIKVFF